MQNRVFVKKGPAFIFKKFFSGGAIAAFSDNSRDLGFSAGKAIAGNRSIFLKSLGIDYKKLVSGQQVHGSGILIAHAGHRGRGAVSRKNRIKGTDGFITRQKNLPLAVFTADCLPVFLFDPKNEIIGLVHAGWRGTEKRIAAQAVKLMAGKFGTNPKDLLIGFGPAIRKCCYEVGEEFEKVFHLGIARKKGKYYLDLIANNQRQLLDFGVDRRNIFDSGICVSCQNRNFFSFRQEGEKAGRMMSVIMLKGKAERDSG